MNPDIVWGAILSVGAAYETYAILNKKNGDTLSERTRDWFRTRTKTGRAVFTGSWIAFSVWFLIHIINGG